MTIIQLSETYRRFSNKIMVHRIAWLSIVLQLLSIFILAEVFHVFIISYNSALNLALCVYLSALFLLRNLVPRNHRKGVRAFKAGDYLQAIAEFDKSYEFFTRHPWIDRYRFLVLLSSSRISYTEMALINAAYCYAQVGDGQKAVEFYKKTLHQFPDSEIAKGGLNMIYALNPDGSNRQDV